MTSTPRRYLPILLLNSFTSTTHVLQRKYFLLVSGASDYKPNLQTEVVNERHIRIQETRSQSHTGSSVPDEDPDDIV